MSVQTGTAIIPVWESRGTTSLPPRMQMPEPHELEQELHDALSHLHDPGYVAPPLICSTLGCGGDCGALTVQSALLRAIEDARPPTDIPPGSRARLAHEVLYSRYVLRLTQDETGERLHVSVTSVWRLQREAIHTLALTLRERSNRSLPSADETPHRDLAEAPLPDWRAQTRDELASLRAGAPDSVADVREAIDGVLELMAPLVEKRGKSMDVAYVQPDLMTAMHPTVLRQVLITALRTMAQHALPGVITLYAGLGDGSVSVSLSAAIEDGYEAAFAELTQQPLAPGDVAIAVSVNGSQVFLELKLPAVGTCTVLVVDDNPDTVQFYRRATDGTNYQIVHCESGGPLFENVERSRPDIIVLDVMLPDVDGWELLTRLRQHPGMRTIPVVLCSVVREEELALALGATLFLSKPVGPREFVRALDQAAGRRNGGKLR